MHHVALVIGIDDKLALLIKLTICYLTHVNDTGGILMIAKQNISLSFALTNGFARLRLDLKNVGVS